MLLADLGYWLLGFGELQDHAVACAGFDRGKLAVPFVDQNPIVFDTAKFEELRGQGILPDAVGIGFTLRASDQRFGVAFGFGNFLGGFGLGCLLAKPLVHAPNQCSRSGTVGQKRQTSKLIVPVREHPLTPRVFATEKCPSGNITRTLRSSLD